MSTWKNNGYEIGKIVLIYVFLGSVWIWGVDTAIGWLVDDRQLPNQWTAVKWPLFIAVTAALLYGLIARLVLRMQRAHAGQRDNDDRWRLLVKNASDSLVILNADGSQRYVSPAAERMTGFAVSELEGKTLDAIIHPDDLERVQTAWNEAVGHPEQTVTVQYRHVHKTRGWVFFEAIAQSFLDEPAIRGVIACVRDIHATKVAVEALAHKDALLSAMLRNLPFDFWARDTTQQVIMQSDESIRLWGDLAATPELDWSYPAETLERWRANNDRVMRGEQVSEECTLVTQHGERRDYYNIVAPIHDGEAILGILGINIDITDHKLAVQALRESEERFANAFEYAPIGMALVSTQGNIIKVNRAACDLFGYEEHELLTKTFQDLTHPDDLATDLAFVEQMIAGQRTTYQMEKRYFHRQGHVVWALLSVSSVRTREGALRYFISQVVDITGRKQAEEELRRREHQMQKIFEILPIGLWFIDKEGTILRGNPVGVAIWGDEAKVPISEYGRFKAWRLPSREPVGPEEWAVARTLRHGTTTRDELLEIESFDGQRKTILNYSAPVLDDNGNIDGAIALNLDVSDRQRLEEQLLQAQKMESIGRLAGGVAHDFNNMLSVILGHVELAMHTLAPDHPLHKRLQIVSDAAQRSADLTRQLLAFARKQTMLPRMLDLNETVAGMLQMLHRLMGEDIELVWLPGSNLGPIKMDPSQLDQILVNLCVNARDAIGDTGKVTIETGDLVLEKARQAGGSIIIPGRYATLTVGDTGRGMDQATLAHLFEPFFTTKEIGRGTGLGLATVYGIVQQNNGFIEVASAPGRGTTFTMYLPVHAAPIDTSPTSAGEPAARGDETILLVEDEPMILELTQAILEDLGYTVLPAATPEEALRLAEEHAGTIDLLMADVIMPGMNGRDLARILVARRPSLKLLFMSGYTADVIAHHGVLEEGVHFMHKPFSSHALAAKVRETLEAEQSRHHGEGPA